MRRFFLGVAALAVTANAEALSCTTDSCLGVVAKVEATASTRLNRTADCASFLQGTVLLATRTEFETTSVTSTSTVTRDTTSTTKTQTLTTGTVLPESRASDEPWKSYASEHEVVDRLRKRESISTTVVFPTKTPAYASQCSSLSAYKSACSCVVVNTTVTTASAPTTTSTVVVTDWETLTTVIRHYVNATRFANATAAPADFLGSGALLRSKTASNTAFGQNGIAFATGLNTANGNSPASRNSTWVQPSQTTGATAATRGSSDSTDTSSSVHIGNISKAAHKVEDAVPTTKPALIAPASNTTATISGNSTSPNNGTSPSLSGGVRFSSNNSSVNITRLDFNRTGAAANLTSTRPPFAFLNATGTSSARLSNTTDPARWRNNTTPRFTNTSSTSTTATIDKTCGETSTPLTVQVSQEGGNINEWYLRLSGNSIIFTSQASRSSRFAVGGSGRLCAVGAKGPLDNAVVAVVENKTDMATSPLWFVDGGLVANLTERGYAELNCSSSEGTLSCAFEDMRTWLGCGLQLGLSSNDGGEFEGIECKGVGLVTQAAPDEGNERNSTITSLAAVQSNGGGIATALPITVGLPTSYEQIR